MTLVSELEATQMELVESETMMRTIVTRTISCEQEWRLHKFVNVWNKTVSKTSSNAKTLLYPGFCCAAKVSRRPQFFVWNIIVLMVRVIRPRVTCVICVQCVLSLRTLIRATTNSGSIDSSIACY